MCRSKSDGTNSDKENKDQQSRKNIQKRKRKSRNKNNSSQTTESKIIHSKASETKKNPVAYSINVLGKSKNSNVPAQDASLSEKPEKKKYACIVCGNNASYHCDICENTNFCTVCIAAKYVHKHDLINLDPTAPNDNMVYTMDTLDHACECRGKDGCNRKDCYQIRRILNHARVCSLRAEGKCEVCKLFINHFPYHAKRCTLPFCLVSFARIEKKIDPILHGPHLTKRQDNMRFMFACNICSGNARYHCNSCTLYDLCTFCFVAGVNHPHMFVTLQADDMGVPNDDTRYRIDMLMHACQCRDANCFAGNGICHVLKHEFQHMRKCHIVEKVYCEMCKRLVVCLAFHAMWCSSPMNACPISHCDRIRAKLMGNNTKQPSINNIQANNNRSITNVSGSDPHITNVSYTNNASNPSANPGPNQSANPGLIPLASCCPSQYTSHVPRPYISNAPSSYMSVIPSQHITMYTISEPNPSANAGPNQSANSGPTLFTNPGPTLFANPGPNQSANSGLVPLANCSSQYTSNVPRPYISNAPSPYMSVIPSPHITNVPRPYINNGPNQSANSGPTLFANPGPNQSANSGLVPLANCPSQYTSHVPRPYISNAPSPYMSVIPSPHITNVPRPYINNEPNQSTNPGTSAFNSFKVPYIPRRK